VPEPGVLPADEDHSVEDEGFEELLLDSSRLEQFEDYQGGQKMIKMF